MLGDYARRDVRPDGQGDDYDDRGQEPKQEHPSEQDADFTGRWRVLLSRRRERGILAVNVLRMNPTLARKTWRTLEPVHGMIYFVPEAGERYEKIGLKGDRMGYFASRAAAMGPVPAEVVIATFFNFSPDLVRRAIPAAWELARTSEILEARLEAADAALRRGLGAELLESKGLREAADLARTAAEAASTMPQGRPLFAAHASLAWPDEPHLVLWHAQTLLREYRGDGHIASLLEAELDPVEALITHAAAGEVDVRFLRPSRAWTDEAWAAGIDRLRSRGLIEPGDAEIGFTEAGAELRQRVEDHTDLLSTPAYAAIGEDGCNRLRELGRPVSVAVVNGGLLNVDPSRFAEDA